MSETAPGAPAPQASLDGNLFARRLWLATLGLVFFYIVILILEKFQALFQPLFIAIFIGYLNLPLHRWLEGQGVPSVLAYVLIVALIVGCLFGLGTMVYFSYGEFRAELPRYEERANELLRRVLKLFNVENVDKMTWRDLPGAQQAGSLDQVLSNLGAAVGVFADFFTGLAITFVYFVFLVAEKVSFHNRLAAAFGVRQSENIQAVFDTINQSITHYLAVKTTTGALAALLSLMVLVVFGIHFFVLWAFLIFVLNYIPYLGSLVAVALPIVMSLVQYDSLGSTLVIALLLVTIQQVIGMIVEPRMAGRRLGISPLLILLSLAFWGKLWGIVGMILAVPLLVVVKAVLQNIKETKPLATLMSNE